MCYLVGYVVFIVIAYLFVTFVNYKDNMREIDNNDIKYILWAGIVWPLFLIGVPLALLCIGWIYLFEQMPSGKDINSYFHNVVCPQVDAKLKQGLQKCKEIVLVVVTNLKEWFANLMGP